MIRKGSFVRFVGKDRAVNVGTYLLVHDVKGDSVVVWLGLSNKGKWTKRTVNASDLEVVVE